MTTHSIILPICQFQIRIKLKAKEDSESPNPTSWLSNEAWAQICSLQQLEAFKVKKEIKDVTSIEKILLLQDLKEDFVTHEENWKLIFDALEPVGSLTTSSTRTKLIED